jgi:lipopolysaccharide transport system ATP-binding protein
MSTASKPMAVIEVENLCKHYRLGSIGARSFLQDCAKFGRSIGLPLKEVKTNNTFTALDDVSFRVEEGEVLGIIGANGAGKSTLLKILSRITEPTSGKAVLHGRVASLLEVGTGFHGDMTGRENIFLNGSLCGLSKKEIKRQFDSIVDFAQIEKFIDTPVKRYSSGMYVRLAFGVAAHLQPEILIIDEVLAVGDADFQKKCIGKMKDVSQSGRTVLFVSHQLGMVRNLCSRCIHLSNGKIAFDGKTEAAITHYIDERGNNAIVQLKDRSDRTGMGNLRFSKVTTTGDGISNKEILSGKGLLFEIEIDKIKDIRGPFWVAIAIYDEWGTQLSDLSNLYTDQPLNLTKEKKYLIACNVGSLPLKQGKYVFSCFMRSVHGVEDFVRDAGIVEVDDGDYFNTGKSLIENQGSILMKQNWQESK